MPSCGCPVSSKHLLYTSEEKVFQGLALKPFYINPMHHYSRFGFRAKNLRFEYISLPFEILHRLLIPKFHGFLRHLPPGLFC